MRDEEEDYISLYKGGGCSSKIGRVGGRQTLSLASGCDRMATIMHEFTHSLGIKHAQSRPDRDDYVEIMWDNISDGKENNFAMADPDAYTTFGTPYNYMSVMHYSKSGFSNNGENTINTLDPFYQDLIGQRASYTTEDTENIQLLYAYSDPEVDPDNCKCDRFEFSGFDQQGARNGIYTIDKSILVGERYSFTHETNEHHFYYRRSSYQWWVGSTSGGSSRGIQSHSVEVCPENIDMPWWQYNSGEWEIVQDAEVRCIDSVRCCKAIMVRLYLSVYVIKCFLDRSGYQNRN